MSAREHLAERLRQIAESQRMDFDSPNVALTLDEAADALDATPAPRTATTAEALLDMFQDPDWFDVAVRDAHGRLWIVWETDRGDYFATSQRYEDDDIQDASHRPLSNIALPDTVLAPAIDPDDEALVERVARAVAGADYMLPEHASPGTTAWEAAPYLRAEWTMIARAALKAVTS